MRKLALFSFSFSCAVFLAYYVFSGTVSPYTAVVMLSVSAAAAVLSAATGFRKNRTVRACVIILLGFSLGLVCFHARAGLAPWEDSGDVPSNGIPWTETASVSLAVRIDDIFSDDTAFFMKALMLGNKQDLYSREEAYDALTGAGLMHIVAVSGMHVAFVVSILQLLLGKGLRSALISIVTVWVFVLITGAPASAVRAGFMQTVMLFAPVLKRENDPLTSLSAALAVILAINPMLCSDIGLQLSFGAMLGLTLFSQPLFDALNGEIRSDRLRSVLRYPLSTLSASVAILVFTAPLMIIHFGYVSVFSPLSNILCLWIVPVCFGGGYAAVGLSMISAWLGRVAAAVVSAAAQYVLVIAGIISSSRYSLLYFSGQAMVAWLVFVYAVIVLFVFSRFKPLTKALLVIAFAAVSLSGVSMANSMYYSSSGYVAAVDVEQGQCLCLFDGDTVMMVDCGSSSLNCRNPGRRAYNYLRSRGKSSVDVLLLTHLHDDHVNGVTDLLELMPVGAVVLPRGVEDDEGMLAGITEAAGRNGTEVRFITSDERFDYGDITLSLFAPDESGDANESCMCISARVHGYSVLITGDSPASSELELAGSRDIGKTDLLIAGHHGSKYSTATEFLQQIKPDTAIVSVGSNYYGHPSAESLGRLNVAGCDIYRTDLNGTTEIRIRSTDT